MPSTGAGQSAAGKGEGSEGGGGQCLHPPAEHGATGPCVQDEVALSRLRAPEAGGGAFSIPTSSLWERKPCPQKDM